MWLDFLPHCGETEGIAVTHPLEVRTMHSPLAAPDILNREFFEIRCKLLELAASLDRLERAEGSVEGDRRLDLVHEALDVLQKGAGDRAEQIQLLFSRPYDDDWQRAFNLAPLSK